jgi:hypothetical protein
VIVVSAIIVLAVVGTVQARKRMRELLAYAAANGWSQGEGVAQLPPVVAKVLRSRRSKLALHRQDRPMWMAWHRWSEETHTSTSNTSSSRTYDETHYFLALPRVFPDMSVARRTKVGAFFKPRRGIGTGDDEFDRLFVIKPVESLEAIRTVNSRLMQALRSGTVPPFAITGNVLHTRYDDVPSTANLMPRTGAISGVARLL